MQICLIVVLIGSVIFLALILPGEKPALPGPVGPTGDITIIGPIGITFGPTGASNIRGLAGNTGPFGVTGPQNTTAALSKVNTGGQAIVNVGGINLTTNLGGLAWIEVVELSSAFTPGYIMFAGSVTISGGQTVSGPVTLLLPFPRAEYGSGNWPVNVLFAKKSSVLTSVGASIFAQIANVNLVNAEITLTVVFPDGTTRPLQGSDLTDGSGTTMEINVDLFGFLPCISRTP